MRSRAGARACARRCFYAPLRVRTRVLTVILGACELELVPPELVSAPSVKRRARVRRRAPEHLLLDQAEDHKALRGVPDGDRRGRPDIVHLVMLLVQDSPLAAKGAVRLLVHTREDVLIRSRSDLRPPRSQATFYPLCEDLLRQGSVPVGRPLLWLERGRSLASVVEAEARGPVVLLHESGEPARSGEFARWAREGDLTVVLGGFPKGDWVVRPRADRTVRVADRPVTAASALVPVLAGVEDALL